MKCPYCGIEMTRERKDVWKCRNPRCPQKQKKEGKQDEPDR